jgi:hypothetical protein
MNAQPNTITTPFSFYFSFPSTIFSVSPRPLFNFTTSTIEKMDYVIIEDVQEPVDMDWTPEPTDMDWIPEPVPMDWEHEPFSIEYDENGFDPDL